jgi:hypothetical protein
MARPREFIVCDALDAREADVIVLRT